MLELLSADPELIQDDVVECVIKGSAGGNAESMGCLGRIYRDGKGVEKDLNKALELFEYAASKNPSWYYEYADLLYVVSTEQSFEKLLSLSESGNSIAMGRLARAYRDGHGVQKDLEKAELWFFETVKRNPAWAYELFDFLWKRGDDVCDKKLVNCAS